MTVLTEACILHRPMLALTVCLEKTVDSCFQRHGPSAAKGLLHRVLITDIRKTNASHEQLQTNSREMGFSLVFVCVETRFYDYFSTYQFFAK